MGVRTGSNAPLGCPAFGVAHADDKDFPLGTIVNGYDSATGTHAEYIWLQSPTAIAVGDDVDFNATTYDATEATADTGAADAIVASADGEYAWFKLKARQPLA